MLHKVYDLQKCEISPLTTFKSKYNVRASRTVFHNLKKLWAISFEVGLWVKGFIAWFSEYGFQGLGMLLAVEVFVDYFSKHGNCSFSIGEYGH